MDGLPVEAPAAPAIDRTAVVEAPPYWQGLPRSRRPATFWAFTERTGVSVTTVEEARKVLGGSSIQTAKVRGPGKPDHGRPHYPCEDTCGPVLAKLAVDYR